MYESLRRQIGSLLIDMHMAEWGLESLLKKYSTEQLTTIEFFTYEMREEAEEYITRGDKLIQLWCEVIAWEQVREGYEVDPTPDEVIDPKEIFFREQLTRGVKGTIEQFRRNRAALTNANAYLSSRKH